MSRDLWYSPLGPLTLYQTGEVLTALHFGDTGGEEELLETPLSRCAKEELSAYFEGRLRVFSVPLSITGSTFSRRILGALAEIPYGTVITYGELARRAGSPSAARATGSALHRNPLPLFLPCHRVVAQGGIGGFGPGLEAKRFLLCLEGVLPT